jgi:hypothetical protein
MLNHVIDTFFPAITARFPAAANQTDKYLAFYDEVRLPVRCCHATGVWCRVVG